ncbi:MAG: hypothetical protein J1E35_01675 [Lachnospiraceae bacterium]|nr:hypothetical protein [Lachnospiraceae bacterium]
MNKKFFELGYEILSHYKHFPEIDDTCKIILDGINYLNNYPKNDNEFKMRKEDIANYIVKSRINNMIYIYVNSKMVVLNSKIGKSIYDDNINELFEQLKNAIAILILKGIHQIVKNMYPELNDNEIIKELVGQDIQSLFKYGLL